MVVITTEPVVTMESEASVITSATMTVGEVTESPIAYTSDGFTAEEQIDENVTVKSPKSVYPTSSTQSDAVIVDENSATTGDILGDVDQVDIADKEEEGNIPPRKNVLFISE